MKWLYMVVTDDEYELPIMVTDSLIELARWTGRSLGSVKSSLTHYYAGRSGSNLRRVKVEE